MATTAGYSGTPLPKKLGIKSGETVTLLGAPDDFDATLGELPAEVRVMVSRSTDRARVYKNRRAIAGPRHANWSDSPNRIWPEM